MCVNIQCCIFFFSLRIKISISLARTRSSLGLVRWHTWRSCVLTSCVWHVSASRRLSAAGWPAKNTWGWGSLRSQYRDMYGVTRHAGKSRHLITAEYYHVDLAYILPVYFFLSVMLSFCDGPEQLLSFRGMFVSGRPGDTTSSSALQLSLFSASWGPTWLNSSTIR